MVQAVETASTKTWLRDKRAEGVRRTERRPVTRKKVGEMRGTGRFCAARVQGKDSGLFSNVVEAIGGL